MLLPAWSSAFALSIVHSTLAQPRSYGTSYFHPKNIIDRDVAIIGGGSSGTHAAISLKDKGKSIIVIEKQGRLGGHTETYDDPATGIPIDYAVQIWHNTSIVRDYFQRFRVPLEVKGGWDIPSINYDFQSGTAVNVNLPSQEAVGAALGKYAAFLAQYPELDKGLFLPDPVPEDLVMSFGQFADKYGIKDLVQTMFFLNQGIGDFLNTPVLEHARVAGLSLIQQMSSNGFLTSARHNNSEIYGHAQSELLAAQSLLLSSTVLSSNRTDTGVQLIVQTPSGKKLIRAKKLLITIPPSLSSLAPFAIDAQERSVFSKLVGTGYFASIVKNTGTPDSIVLYNYAPNSMPYNLPLLPGAYLIQPTLIPGLKVIPYASYSSALTDAEVKADILATIKRLQAANPDVFEQTEPEFVAFSRHAPFYLQARAEDIKNGIYEDMYALQGLRNTYWSGAAWRAQDSSALWEFNEGVVVPMVVGGL